MDSSSAIVDAARLTEENRPLLARLRRQWAFVALLYVVGLAAGYLWLDRVMAYPAARHWLVAAGVVMVIELGIYWVALPHNHRDQESNLLPGLGYGTWLTLVCGLLLFYLGGFLASPWPEGFVAWLPAILYTAARIVDLFDGYVARINGQETKLGAILDIELDGLGVLLAIILAIQYGQIPIWYLPLAVSRQLFVAGLWWLRRQGKPTYDLPPSENRRVIAGFQTGFLCVMLWPILAPPMTTLAAVLFATPLILSFGRDWLVVSGVWRADSPVYQARRAAAKRWCEGWLPFVARMAGTILALGVLWRAYPDFAAWQAWLASVGMPASPGIVQGFALVALLTLLPFAAGVAARTAALIVLALAALDISANGLEWASNAWLLVAAVIVAHAGSGYLSFWRPEEPLLHRRFGAPRLPTP